VTLLPGAVDVFATEVVKPPGLDGDAPVSPYTVGQELGHGGDSLVKRVYGHLGTVRHRSKAVEYRVQQHLKAEHREKPVREWVKALRAA